MIFSAPFIRGVAAVVPKNRVVLENLAAELNVDVKNIMRLSGIREVRKSAPDKTVSDYCVAAAEILIDELNFDKSQIDGVIFVTTNSDYLTPGSGFIVHDRLNLSNNCLILDLNQACAGFVNALFQAFLMIQGGFKNILICAGNTPTKKINPRDKSLRMVMGDAGTAALISAGEKFQSAFNFYSDGKGLKFLYIPAGGAKIPLKAGVTDVEETDAQGNIRALENYFMDGLEVMAFSVNVAPKNISATLEKIGWEIDSVDKFFLHQANNFMVSSIRKRLKVPAEKVPFALENFGNCGCGSIPLALCLENPKNLSRAILCGFGGGLACATAALSLNETHFCEVSEL